MPIVRPSEPKFANTAERRVHDLLLAQLGASDAVVLNYRFTDEAKDHEADAIVLLPGLGIVVVEVKGGRVWHAQGEWWQASHGASGRRIHPVDQARDAKYGLRTLVERDVRWRGEGRSRVRWAHAVVVVNTSLGTTSPCPTAHAG